MTFFRRLNKLYTLKAVMITTGIFILLDIFLHLNILSTTPDERYQHHHLIKSFKKQPYRDGYQIKSKDNSDSVKQQANKKIWKIAVWSQGKRFKRRFVHSYKRKAQDPFKFCKVRNCNISTEKDSYMNADAVFINLHRLKGHLDFPPKRFSHQKYIMFTDESPLHTFYIARKTRIRQLNGKFNWTMTYTLNSDIPVPYGRTIALSHKEKVKSISYKWLKLKTKMTAIISSNCKPEPRRTYVKKLSKYTPIDSYGQCGTLKCSGSAYSRHDCKALHKYKFYLAFENSLCKEYITEKVWWNAFHHNSIPVVLGPPRSDYEKLLPPNSFLHVEDYKSPKQLAKHLEYLDKNVTAYKEYFEWKKSYKVLNEHGYFGTSSLHICRICEALNSRNISKIKTYKHLNKFWNKKKMCRKVKYVKNFKNIFKKS